jgi:sugar/nucleoside kinase (ribokinase family)
MKGGEKTGLLCAGNAMVDVFASLDGEEAGRLGIHEPVQHPDYERIAKILPALPGPLFSAGGGAATVARIAALLGTPSRFIGAIGVSETGTPDAFGRLFEEGLSRAGVLPCLFPVKLPTGICIILRLPGGETRIAASPSAALHLSASAIPEEAMEEAAVLVLEGFMLDREDPARRILEGARRYGSAAALDIGSAAIATAWAGKIVRYCRDYPLVLFMNEDEATAFCRALTGKDAPAGKKPGRTNSPEAAPAGKRPGRTNSPEAAPVRGPLSGEIQDVLKSLSAEGGPTGNRGAHSRGEPFPVIVVKRGPLGAVVFAGGRACPVETTALAPVDSTGAGDAFAAAFLAAFIRHKPLAECADLGNRTAREVLDLPGSEIPREKLRHIAEML